MKIKIDRITILIFSLSVLVFGFRLICYAQQELLLDYPEIGGEDIAPKTPLPEVIKYIYMFSLAIVGIVALLSMLIGALKYVLSAGNPSKAADAKDQIFSAILGIILLLASVMILRTINPELVTIGFEVEPISGGGGNGWACYYCHPPTTYPDPSLWCDKNTYPQRYNDQKFCRTDIETEVEALALCSSFQDARNIYFLVKYELCK